MTIKSLLAAMAVLSATSANAVIVSWTDWQSATPTVASGQITSGLDTINVTLGTSGEPLHFVQTDSGTNFWGEGLPAPYTGGVVGNAPATPDIVALSTGGTKTITFSQAITDPYIAMVSWNGNVATFTQAFEKISEGCGHWGCGTFSLGVGNSFVGVGEVHGILRFVGTFTSVSFTDNSEGWHGLTVGIGGVYVPPPPPPPPREIVPEPASWAMLIAGFGLVGAAMRRRVSARVAG